MYVRPLAYMQVRIARVPSTAITNKLSVGSLKWENLDVSENGQPQLKSKSYDFFTVNLPIILCKIESTSISSKCRSYGYLTSIQFRSQSQIYMSSTKYVHQRSKASMIYKIQ